MSVSRPSLKVRPSLRQASAPTYAILDRDNLTREHVVQLISALAQLAQRMMTIRSAHI